MVLSALISINWWAILACAAAGFVIGGVYFGALTPKYYASALGREYRPGTPLSLLSMLGPFVCNVVMIVTTAAILGMVGPSSVGDALALGLLIGVGYLIAMCMTIAINPNFPKPFSYTLINAPYFLLNSLVTCTILFLFR